MDKSKTRIWSRGPEGLRQASPVETPQLTDRSWSPLAGDARAERPRPPPLPAARPSALHATRILPIERLLPGFAPAPSLEPAAKPVRRQSSRTRAYALLSALTLVAVAAWQIPRTRSSVRVRALTPAKDVAPKRAAESARADGRWVAPAAGDELVPAREDGPASPQLTAARPNPVSSPAPPPDKLERAAVDALIAGDYARARRLYLQLAAAVPAPRTFQEAARILANREPR